MNQTAAVAATPLPALTRVATYERVSSEDQKERETIKMQSEELARRLVLDPTRVLVKRFIDDGITSRVPLAKRPAGSQLMADAMLGLFDEVWVYKLDRLSRPIRDTVTARDELEDLGVTVCSATQHVTDRFSYNIHAVFGDHELVTIRERLVGGARSCAAAGFYVGGVISYGYRPKPDGRRTVIVPSDVVIWGDLTEAAVVRKAYEHVGIDGWSCRRVVEKYNTLGIPTAEEREGMGRRKVRTQGLWRAGRLRNMLVNPVYKGELVYGRRNTKVVGTKLKKETIRAHVEPLVSEELWQATQDTLARNRLCVKNTSYVYLLRSKIVCATCGLNYIGSRVRGADVWYRCNGYMTERGPHQGRCPSKGIKGDHIEPLIWADIEAWLRNPGHLLEELQTETGDDACNAMRKAEEITLQAAIQDLDQQRMRIIDMYQRSRITSEELESRLDEVVKNRATLVKRLQALQPEDGVAEEPLEEDLLARIHERLDDGLSAEERSQLIHFLVRRVTVYTELLENGKKRAHAVIEYRFPKPDFDVVSTPSGTGSWPPPT